MTIDAAYTRWSGSYDADRNITRDLDQSATASVLGARRFALAVEAGCGTGKNTPLLARISTSVLALDFSPGMLEKARQRVQAAHVAFHQADLLQRWPCGDASAALVTCNLVLEHIEDIAQVAREAARVLLPGGLLFISELHPYRQYRGSQARFVDADGSTTFIPAYRHDISEFLRAGRDAGFVLDRLDEWWHEEDKDQPPRVLTLLLRKDAVPSG